MTNTPNDNSVCVVCRGTISEGATKCASCDNFQDWRRHILTWSGVITALLALVPVWGGAVSLYKLAFPGDAEVRIRTIECQQKKIKVAAFNSGGKVGLLTAPRVTVIRNQEQKSISVNFSIDEDDTELLSKELDIIELALTGSHNFPTQTTANGGCKLRISFQVETLAGSKFERKDECSCPVSSY
jgi:hypothetical protein